VYIAIEPAISRMAWPVTMNLRTRFIQFVQQQAPNRVYWLLFTGMVARLIGFISNQFDGQDIHTLAAAYVDTRLNPINLIQNWEAAQKKLAWLEIAIDTCLFIPAYAITFATWCWYFASRSLFVTNPNQPTISRFMGRLGRAIAWGVLVGVLFDLIENVALMSWLSGGWFNLSYVGMGVVRVFKFLFAGLAAFYVLLHPLGIVFSVREAFFRLINSTLYTQEASRQNLLGHITERREAQVKIDKALVNYLRIKAPAPSRNLTFRDYLQTGWRGFLNVQFVVYLLVFMGGIFQLDQFDELFYFLLTEPRGLSVLLATLVALGLWGGMVYVCSKILLFVQPTYFGELDPGKPDTTARLLDHHQPELRLLRNTPVWLAHSPFWLMALTLALNFSRLSAANQRTPTYAYKYVLILLMLAAVYVLFISIIRYFHRALDERDIVLFKSTNPAGDYALLLDLAPRSILFGQGLLVTIVLLFLPTATGLVLAQTIGLYAVVMLWLAGLAYLGTILYQFNRLPDYPVLVGLILAVMIFSRYNDNSDIRFSPQSVVSPTGENPDSSLAVRRPSVEAYYTRWLQTRFATASARPDSVASADTLPVVVIATAGGGIRATAWTTEVLYQLNRQIRGFDRYVFGISGVSGGGVGAATYVATLGGHLDSTVRMKREAGAQRRMVSGTYTYDSARFLGPLRSVVSEDLISPIAASMLFRGGLHNFMPFPIRSLDRNRWLEDAWERRLLADGNTLNANVRGLLPQSFLSLWPSRATLATDSLRLPALLLNGAVPETGQKIIMSNLMLGNTADPRNPFYDVADLFASTRRDVPYKTATFLCARFPFVTSGGKASGPLPNITGDCANGDYHIIDGGYAENTGILTAVQLIKNLQRVEKVVRTTRPSLLGNRVVQYYLLFLPNYAASEAKGSVATFRFLSEPVKGFLNTWDRNGVGLDQLIGRTLRRDEGGLSFAYTSLTLDTKKHRYPLGWYISPTAVETMGQQATANIRDSLRIKTTFFSQLQKQIQVNKQVRRPKKVVLGP